MLNVIFKQNNFVKYPLLKREVLIRELKAKHVPRTQVKQILLSLDYERGNYDQL